MVKLVSALGMKRADEQTIQSGVTSVELMKRVAAGVLENAFPGEGRSLIVSGKGGNGGDGYALYLLMQEKGLAVDIVDFGESKHEGAAELRKQCKDIKPFDEGMDFSAYQTIFDCIFGIGLSRTLSGEALSCIKKINRSGANVISADIPSGISQTLRLKRKSCTRSSRRAGSLRPPATTSRSGFSSSGAQPPGQRPRS